jgi:hypothetical protein
MFKWTVGLLISMFILCISSPSYSEGLDWWEPRSSLSGEELQDHFYSIHDPDIEGDLAELDAFEDYLDMMDDWDYEDDTYDLRADQEYEELDDLEFDLYDQEHKEAYPHSDAYYKVSDAYAFYVDPYLTKAKEYASRAGKYLWSKTPSVEACVIGAESLALATMGAIGIGEALSGLADAASSIGTLY